MNQFAIKNGKVLKGGEPDRRQASVMIINDLQRGKLPYFVPPPFSENEVIDQKEEEPMVEDGAVLNIDEDKTLIEQIEDVNTLQEEQMMQDNEDAELLQLAESIDQ